MFKIDHGFPQRLLKSIFGALFCLFLLFSVSSCHSTVTAPTQSLSPTIVVTTIVPATETVTPKSSLTSTVKPVTITPRPTSTITATSLPSLFLEDGAYLAIGKIALMGDNGIDIKTINADGSNLQKITDNILGHSVAWSPDGNWIVYDLTTKTTNFMQTTTQLFLIDKDGKNQKQITNSNFGKYAMAWSPSGKEISFSPTFPDDIVAIERNGNYLRKITNLNHGVSYGVWSPDGTQMAFLYAQTGINFSPPEGIAVINLSDGIPRWVIKFPVNEGSGIDWSPDGQFITFSSSHHGNYQDYWSPTEGIVQTLEPGELDCGDIFSVKIDGSELKQLTHLPGCSKSPVWSPDGKYIAFLSDISPISHTYSDDWEPFIMKRDGAEITQIFNYEFGSMAQSIAWSRVPGLRIGQKYHLTQLGNKAIVRQEPLLKGNPVTQLIPADQVTVLSNPVDADGFYWRKVMLEDGKEGWVQEVAGWFAPVEGN